MMKMKQEQCSNQEHRHLGPLSNFLLSPNRKKLNAFFSGLTLHPCSMGPWEEAKEHRQHARVTSMSLSCVGCLIPARWQLACLPTCLQSSFWKNFLHTFTVEDELICEKVLPTHTVWLVLEQELKFGCCFASVFTFSWWIHIILGLALVRVIPRLDVALQPMITASCHLAWHKPSTRWRASCRFTSLQTILQKMYHPILQMRKPRLRSYWKGLPRMWDPEQIQSQPWDSCDVGQVESLNCKNRETKCSQGSFQLGVL